MELGKPAMGVWNSLNSSFEVESRVLDEPVTSVNACDLAVMTFCEHNQWSLHPVHVRSRVLDGPRMYSVNACDLAVMTFWLWA